MDRDSLSLIGRVTLIGVACLASSAAHAWIGDGGPLTRQPEGSAERPSEAEADEDTTDGAREPAGQPWSDMDYGPSLTLTLEAGEGNFAYKGVAIRLDDGPGGVSRGSEFVVFDTDTLRYAASWRGEFIDWKCIHFDGTHEVHPRLTGTILFQNPPGPGWASPGTSRFSDERLVGRDGKHYGPLEREWGHWKGHYHYGDQVVLSYTVGSTHVFEMPSAEGDGDVRSMARTLNVGPRELDLILQVAHEPKRQLSRHTAGKGGRARSYIALVAKDQPLPSQPPTGNGETPFDPGGVLCIGLVGDQNASEWLTSEQGDVRLSIPAGEDSARLKLVYARVASADQLGRFEELLADSHPPQDLEPLTRGGPPKWTESVTTDLTVIGEADGPYIAEAISVPHDNPYRSWMRLGGFDFFDDGRRAAVCTWQGDVWIVDGIGAAMGEGPSLTWRRIASGMFQPLGLKIVRGDIYVTCRDQITILRDLNGDGETDFYESFNNDHQVTDHFHEFAVGLQTDKDGNFYYAKCARHARDALVPQHGTLLAVSPDGSKTEIVARGYRAPNGVCINDDGTFFLSDQEGHWTPKNRINWVKPGGFYGNMMAYHDGREAGDFELPVCWIHNDFDRSPAEQLWVTGGKWGPLENSLISLSYGTGEIHLVLREKVGSVMQGGLIRLPISDFPTGIMRGRFHPGDGQLYACGLFGWSSDKTAPGGFYRVRYTGRPLHVPVKMHATRDGMTITFTEPLDEGSATNYRNWSASRWEYRRTQNYGSEDYRVSDPRRRGRDRLRIEAVELADDQRTVRLKIRDMQPAMQMELRYQLRAADGTDLSQLIHHTVHTLGVAAELTGGE
jgi:hypothetical protein